MAKAQGVTGVVAAPDLGLSPGTSDAALLVDFTDAAAFHAFQNSPERESYVVERVAPQVVSLENSQIFSPDQG